MKTDRQTDQWLIQDFPGGASTPKVADLTYSWTRGAPLRSPTADKHRTKWITANNHSDNYPLITRPREVTLQLTGAAPCTGQRDPGESVYSSNTGILLRQVEAYTRAHVGVYLRPQLSKLLLLELFLAAGSSDLSLLNPDVRTSDPY